MEVYAVRTANKSYSARLWLRLGQLSNFRAAKVHKGCYQTCQITYRGVLCISWPLSDMERERERKSERVGRERSC